MTHGKSKSKEHRAWGGMKERCYNPNSEVYRHYGGRGIRVCDRWKDSFENFYEDMGDAPKGTSLDRIDTDGDYCPENCRWATHEEQCNNRRSNRLVQYNGQVYTLKQVCQILGIGYRLVHNRLCKGWTLKRALECQGVNPIKHSKL